MSRKRRNTSSPEPEDSPVSKRQRPSLEEDSDQSFDYPLSSERPRCDPIYGQKGAFPGLDDNDDELFYGPPSDGLEYLRMVRSEAKGVPHLLVAPRPPSINQNQTGNGIQNNYLDDIAGGYYADGAYTAIPDTNIRSSSDQDAVDAQDLYYDSLSSRFRLLHATLKCSPPLSTIEELHSSSLISFPRDTETARSQWRYHIQSSDPLMVQIACMDTESVLEVVKLLTGTMAQTIRSRSAERVLRFGAWVWGILGKCRDRTELGSDEIAVIRELGKRAVGLLVRLRDKIEKATGASQEPSESECEDSHTLAILEGSAEETAPVTGKPDKSSMQEEPHPNKPAGNNQDATALEVAKKRLELSFLSTKDLESSAATAVSGDANNAPGIDAAGAKLDVEQQVRITLDMIVTIVGEFYGQRDLLEFRDIWEEL